MKLQLKEGQGVLFINENKKSEKSPNLRGGLLFNGQEINLAGWTKTSKSGKKFISLSAQPDNRPKEESNVQQQLDNDIPTGEEIPF